MQTLLVTVFQLGTPPVIQAHSVDVFNFFPYIEVLVHFLWPLS